MAPHAVRQTCCCFNVRIATTALAIYHAVSVLRPGRPGGYGQEDHCSPFLHEPRARPSSALDLSLSLGQMGLVGREPCECRL